MAGAFVGRSAELQALGAAANEAAAGLPRFVTLEADAGFGKSALLAVAVGALVGWQVLRASADDAESRLPFALLDALVPGITPTTGDPFAAGAALVQHLGDRQEDGPVAVVVDDVHWADPQSLFALSYALRRLQVDRVLALLAIRPAEAARVPAGLTRLAADRGGRLRLDGLTDDDVPTLARALGHPVPTPEAARRLRAHTGGSPLHLTALLAEAPTAALRTRRALAASPSIASLTRDALNRAPSSARALVEAAAVLGMRIPLERAATVARVDSPLVALQDALGTGLVDATDEPDGWTVAFRHPVVRAGVTDTIGPATRAELHTRAAVALADDPVAALAHRSAAATCPDPPVAEALVARAGVDVRAGRHGVAADHLFAAARLTVGGADRDGLVLDAVEMLLLAGEAAEAAGWADRVADLPRAPHRDLVLARLRWLRGRAEEAHALAQRAWRTGSGPEQTSAAALLAQLHLLQLDGTAAASWSARALDAGGLPAVETAVMRGTRAVALTVAGLPDEGAASLADLPADPLGVPGYRRDDLSARGLIRMWTDDYERAVADLLASRPGTRSRDSEPRPYMLVGLSYLPQAEFRAGLWDDSLLHAAEAEALVVDSEQQWLQALALVGAVPVLAGRGLWARAQTQVEAAAAAANRLDEMSSNALTSDAATLLAAFRGDPSGVLAAAEPLRTATHEGAFEPGVFGWEGRRIAALVAVGRLDEADRALTSMTERARDRDRRSSLATAAQLRGDLATARRRPGDARAAYAEAVEIGEGFAAVLDRGRARAALGRFLRRDGKRRAAIAELTAARAVFATLGATPFLQRCDAELAACGVTADPPDASPLAMLTPQERAVARLVVEGRTNREIAAEMVLSVKTIDYHLGNTYAKLGIGSRTQLAARLNDR